MNTLMPSTKDLRFFENVRRIAAAAQTILREEQRPACFPADLLGDKNAIARLIAQYDLRMVQGKVPMPEAVRAAVRVLREWTLLSESMRHAILAEIVNE